MRQLLAFIATSIVVGAVLAGTVFRDDIAQATGLAQAVTISNTPDQAVPVREQNLDAGEIIKVHEQGTANVSVTNLLTVAHQGARDTFTVRLSAVAGGDATSTFGPISASLITLTSMQGSDSTVELRNGSTTLLVFDTDVGDVVVPLTRPLTLDQVQLHCGPFAVPCVARINVVGRSTT